MLLRYITIEYTRMENILVQLLMSQVKKKTQTNQKTPVHYFMFLVWD